MNTRKRNLADRRLRQRIYFTVTSLFILMSMLISACQQRVVETVIVTEVVEKEGKTEIIEKVVVVTPTPGETQSEVVEPEVVEPTTTRNGAWVDTIVFTSIDEAPNAVAQLQADALDVYAYAVEDPDVFDTVKEDANLSYSMSFGYWDSLLFNPSGPTFQDGRLNPFQNEKIREAINWLIDRDYLVQEAVGGLGLPKWVPLNSAFSDYAMYVDLIRPLEAKYAYDFDKANQVITVEMEAMGAVKDANGKWTFDGNPVVVIGLIRSEDEREDIGNYFSNQLEAIGFTVDRQVRTRDELAPIWQQSDPTLGEWHWYTGGNYYPAIARNNANAFAETYTSLVASTTAEEAFNPSPELLDLSTRLLNSDYQSMEERREMFAQALPLALQNSQYVQVMATNSFYPHKSSLVVGSDLSSGIGGSQIWPYTIRWSDLEGGTVRSANSGILTGPWNMVAGQNWLQEQMLVRASIDDATISNPYTGLYMPQRLEKAEVQVLNGIPIQKTLDWASLEFVDQISVSGDAWIDWDAVNQKFITVAEKYPEGLTARSKITVYYPSDLWKIKWHDGSPLSIGDFVNFMIYNFDNAKPESAIYDEAQVSGVEAWLSHFKGVRIVSTDPLVIETYEDQVDLDVENQVGNYYTNRWWPITNTGQMPWHSYTLGMLAEANKELAFSSSKSTMLDVDWTNYIDGPSLLILKKYLDQARAENYIPYAPTLSQYITAEEARLRYENLLTWFTRKGHFWLGTGLFYLEQVNSIEKSVVMERNPDFPDPADKWSQFGEPQIAVVDVSGPVKVKIGEEATFEAFVTFQDTPYPQADLNTVKYLLYDASGGLITTGLAEAVADGHFKVVLSPEVSQKLLPGANKIEFVVVSNVVSIPTFTAKEFLAEK